jgi:tetratricopeptide (TPR) repeat protein
MADDIKKQIEDAWKDNTDDQHDSAIEKFRQILEQDPENPDAIYGLGLAQVGAEQYSEAKATFDHFLDVADKLDPEDVNKQVRFNMLMSMVKQQFRIIEQRTQE